MLYDDEENKTREEVLRELMEKMGDMDSGRLPKKKVRIGAPEITIAIGHGKRMDRGGWIEDVPAGSEAGDMGGIDPRLADIIRKKREEEEMA